MELDEATPALAALAHDSRLAVFRLLVEAGRDGMAAGEVAARIGIAPTTLSFHLSQLSHAGLVSGRRNGRSVIYSADFERMADLVNFLTEDCCKGSLDDCGLAPRSTTTATAAEPRKGG